MRNLIIVACVWIALGCGKKKQDLDDDDFLVEDVKKDLAELKQLLAQGKAKDGKFECAHMANIDDLKASSKHAALAAEFERICTKELYLAIIKLEVEAAEAERKAKPGAEMIDACYSGDYSYSVDEMKKAKTIDAAKDLIARFDAVCAKKK